MGKSHFLESINYAALPSGTDPLEFVSEITNQLSKYQEAYQEADNEPITIHLHVNKAILEAVDYGVLHDNFANREEWLRKLVTSVLSDTYMHIVLDRVLEDTVKKFANDGESTPTDNPNLQA